MPRSARLAGLTLVGWLARRRPDETPHAIGIDEARESERRIQSRERRRADKSPVRRAPDRRRRGPRRDGARPPRRSRWRALGTASRADRHHGRARVPIASPIARATRGARRGSTAPGRDASPSAGARRCCTATPGTRTAPRAARPFDARAGVDARRRRPGRGAGRRRPPTSRRSTRRRSAARSARWRAPTAACAGRCPSETASTRRPCVADDGTIYVGSDAKKFSRDLAGGQGPLVARHRRRRRHRRGVLAATAPSSSPPAAWSTRVTPAGYVRWRFAAKRKVFTAPAIGPRGPRLLRLAGPSRLRPHARRTARVERRPRRRRRRRAGHRRRRRGLRRHGRGRGRPARPGRRARRCGARTSAGTCAARSRSRATATCSPASTGRALAPCACARTTEACAATSPSRGRARASSASTAARWKTPRARCLRRAGRRRRTRSTRAARLLWRFIDRRRRRRSRDAARRRHARRRLRRRLGPRLARRGDGESTKLSAARARRRPCCD